MRRANNQDSHVVVLASGPEAWAERGHLFMVADGMGAHAAGELASKLAVDGVPHLYYKYTEASAPEALQRALVETNGEIHRRGQANADFRNMGTTASALVLLPQGALVAHIGDSRVYRFRQDRLHQLTRDHSLVWELREQLADNGDLAIPKNVITRSLGPNSTVQVDIEGPLPLEAGDTFLLCSDGLTGRVNDEELASILGNLGPEEAAYLLVDLANLRGGPDNITVIVARVTDPALSDAGSEPLKIGGSRQRAAVQPAIWVCLGVCLLAAVVLAITSPHNLLPALSAAAGAIVALIVGLLSRHRGHTPGVALGEGRRLGKGPYTETEYHSGEETVHSLRQLTRELRQTGPDGLRSLDWSEFDTHCRAAEKSSESGQHAEAMRGYSRAIRLVMHEFRESQNRRASDSSIDY
jgi:protein phosphatase